ncbi:MAG: hypothetical protein WCG03_00585 [Kiritimatiellales bacterium]
MRTNDLRIVIDEFLRKSGNVLILNSDSISPGRFMTNGRTVEAGLNFSKDVAYQIVRDPKSKLVAKPCEIPGRGRVLSIGTADLLKEKIGGSLMVEFPVALHASPDRLELEVEAKGAVDLDMLAIRVIDSRNNVWIGFREMTSNWQVCRIPFADLLPVGSNTQALLEIQPSDICKIQVGLDARTMWGEGGGRMAIGKINVVACDEARSFLSGQTARYRAPLKQVEANYPEWLFDPFGGADRTAVKSARFSSQAFAMKGDFTLKAPVDFLPDHDYAAGGAPESFLDHVKRKAARRIPLIEATDTKGAVATLARIDIYSAGPYRGAAMALFGLSEEEYENSKIHELLRRTAVYMARSPRILDGYPAADRKAGSHDFLYRVLIRNPQPSTITGTLNLQMADGLMSSQESISLPPRTNSEIVLNCGAVPTNCPFTAFDLNFTVQSKQSQDEIHERIDVRRTLCAAADHLVSMQTVNFTDGAYSHWFYQDAYGARMLRALGEYTGQRSYIDSALHWAHLMANGQLDNGMFPMGYGMKENSYFIADNGSISLAVAQIASHVSEYEKEILLKSVRRNFEWRETFKVTPERAAGLKAEYGADTAGATPGFYGIGHIRFDYITGNPLPQEFARPEYRGVWYTMACTMAFPSALAQLTGSSEYKSASIADARTYLENKLSATDSYAPEGLIWLYAYLEDKSTHAILKKALTEEFLGYFEKAPERFWLQQGSRQTLLLPALVYAMENIENSPRTRRAALSMVAGLCADSSPYSMLRIGLDRHKGAYAKTSNESLMYIHFGSMGLMELLEPGSTMLKTDECGE